MLFSCRHSQRLESVPIREVDRITGLYCWLFSAAAGRRCRLFRPLPTHPRHPTPRKPFRGLVWPPGDLLEDKSSWSAWHDLQQASHARWWSVARIANASEHLCGGVSRSCGTLHGKRKRAVIFKSTHLLEMELCKLIHSCSIQLKKLTLV